MRLSRNLFAGLTNSAWTAIAGVVSTPFYLHFLGIESYGLVGFFTTLLTLLTLLDLGLSPTMNREVARYAAAGDPDGARHLLRSLEILYWVVAVLLGGILFLASSWVGKRWLQSTHMAPAEIVHAVMLMALVVAVRWPIVLYSSTLMGAQRLAVVSGISIIMVTVGAAGAIFVLAVVSPSIRAFFLWQAVTGLTYVIVIRRAAWKVLGGHRGISFRFDAVRRIWRFSAGLGLMTVTGIFLTQFDKILLSTMVGLAAYGSYMLASLLASGLYLLVTPVFNVLYPRFSALVAVGDTERLAELYSLATRLLATLVFPVAVAVALFSEPLVRLWTHNPILSAQVAPILSLLILGAGLHGVMFLPYALQLAYGQIRLALTINVILIAIYVPLIVVLTRLHAQTGAAIAWFLLHCFYLGIGTWLTHRYLLKGKGVLWLVRNVGIPLCASLLVAFVVSRVSPNYQSSSYEGIIWACVVVMAAASLSLAWSPALRRSLLNNLRFKSNQA
jgi:O-antigen/teichoic acid export membrane protein